MTMNLDDRQRAEAQEKQRRKPAPVPLRRSRRAARARRLRATLLAGVGLVAVSMLALGASIVIQNVTQESPPPAVAAAGEEAPTPLVNLYGSGRTGSPLALNWNSTPGTPAPAETPTLPELGTPTPVGPTLATQVSTEGSAPSSGLIVARPTVPGETPTEDALDPSLAFPSPSSGDPSLPMQMASLGPKVGESNIGFGGSNGGNAGGGGGFGGGGGGFGGLPGGPIGGSPLQPPSTQPLITSNPAPSSPTTPTTPSVPQQPTTEIVPPLPLPPAPPPPQQPVAFDPIVPPLPAPPTPPNVTPPAVPIGTTPGNPVQPTAQDGNKFTLPLTSCAGGCTGQDWRFFDPVVAVGFRYEMNPDSPNGIAKIKMPTLLDKNGNVVDKSYDLFLFDVITHQWVDTGIDLTGDDPFDVVDGLKNLNLAEFGLTLDGLASHGLYSFEILGIDTAALVDPADPQGFITGLLFAGPVSGDLLITALTVDTDDPTADVNNPSDPDPIRVAVPEPATLALLGSGLLGLGLLRRRRR